jgi:hypothetical protein
MLPPPKKPNPEWSTLSELNSSTQNPLAPDPMNRLGMRSSYQTVPPAPPTWQASFLPTTPLPVFGSYGSQNRDSSSNRTFSSVQAPITTRSAGRSCSIPSASW